ncbi:MAG TPA: class I SAM-dependent methyltransferase [Caulifigura sp.]|jgi:SAM-dependent methyltransferase|nr:class I SAM-dependent methyltransferase [Caulifigura sp.]
MPKPLAELLLRESAARPFHGEVATLGRLHVYFTADELENCAARAGAKLAEFPRTLHREPDLARRGFLADDSFLTALGFQSSTRVDYSDYEAAEEILDLNSAETPRHLQQRFDVIIDSGTIEHVFHLPNALAHLARMLKPGGRIIHISPSSNCMDHGFYGFSPTFFTDYYEENHYELPAVQVCRFLKPHEQARCDIYDYTADRGSRLQIGCLDSSVYFVFVVARMTPESTSGVIPQQSAYRRRWSDGVAANTVSRRQQVLEWTRRSPFGQKTFDLYRRYLRPMVMRLRRPPLQKIARL